MLVALMRHASVINYYVIVVTVYNTRVQITNRNGQSHKDKG